MSRRRTVVVAAGLVALMGAGVGAALTIADRDEPPRDRVVVRTASSPSTTASPGTTAAAPSAESLDAAYEQCAIAAGFDPGGVQVLRGDGGQVEWVKTGRDVPASVHGPCFRAIGGSDPPGSSHGNPGP